MGEFEIVRPQVFWSASIAPFAQWPLSLGGVNGVFLASLSWFVADNTELSGTWILYGVYVFVFFFCVRACMTKRGQQGGFPVGCPPCCCD